MRSDELEGFVVDPAVQLFGSTYVGFFRLVSAVGARELLVRTPGRDALWRNGRAHALTYGSVASLITSTALPAALKLRLGAQYLPFLATHARRLDANDPARTGGVELDGRSVAEWGIEHLGEDFVELLAYPLLGAYYGGTPERMSAALYHALAKVGTDVRVHAAAGGMGNLAQRILAALRQRGVAWQSGDPVRRVAVAGRAVSIDSDTGTAEFDGAVIAVPAAAASSLLQAGPPLSEWLAGVESAPTATVALFLDRRPDADYFGLSFPRRYRIGQSVVAACMEHRKAPGLAPDGRGLIVAYPSPMIAGVAAASEANAVVDMVLPPLEEAFPRLADRVMRARVYRLPEGYTLFYPGYLSHINGFDPAWPGENVALAGDYLVAPTVEGAVLSGIRAARRLLGS
jgi:oxygen-dependent protoporphyrinogen oxidase